MTVVTDITVIKVDILFQHFEMIFWLILILRPRIPHSLNAAYGNYSGQNFDSYQDDDTCFCYRELSLRSSQLSESNLESPSYPVFPKSASATFSFPQVSFRHNWPSRGHPPFRRPFHSEAAFHHSKVFIFSSSYYESLRPQVWSLKYWSMGSPPATTQLHSPHVHNM